MTDKLLDIPKLRKQSVSFLAKGNQALREKQFEAATGFYLQAIHTVPGLSKMIAANLAVAQQKYRAQRKKSPRQRVVVCGWNLAGNAAARVYTLAKLYETFADVEIIGSFFPQYDTRLWEPVRSNTIPVHSFVVEDETRFLEQAFELVSAHPCDVVHLSKPRAPNILFGILYKVIWNAQVLVDIDDDELRFVDADKPISLDDYLKVHGCGFIETALDGKDWTRVAVGLVKTFDGITVSNPALKKRYGGEIVRHARDEKRYRPTLELKRRSREKFGIGQDKKVILFCGSPLEHKGLLETADAIAALKRNDVVFVIVGDFPDPALKAKLLKKKEVNYCFIANQPFDSIADVVAMGDVCVLLQAPNAIGIPARLSDALGMGLTVLSALPKGVVDESIQRALIEVNAKSLAKVLVDTLKNDKRAQALKKEATDVFARNMTFTVNADKLRQLCTAQTIPPVRSLEGGIRVLQLLPPSGIVNTLNLIFKSGSDHAHGISVLSEKKYAESRLAANLRKTLSVSAYDRPTQNKVSGALFAGESKNGAPQRKAGYFSIELAGVLLGFIAEPTSIPDIDPVTAVSGIQSLLAFSKLHALSAEDVIKLTSTKGNVDFSDKDLAYIASCGLVTRSNLDKAAVIIADAWFASDFELRCRIESVSDQGVQAWPRVIRCFQFDLSRGELCLNTEISLLGDGPAFINIKLSNPFTPLLFTVTAFEGTLLDMTLLPFPSLCRGGAHYGELSSVGDWSGYMVNLKSVSNSLVEEYIGWFGAPENFAVARLAIDLKGATGAEKIFAAPFKEWLSRVMHIRAVPVDEQLMSQGATVERYLESALSESYLPADEDASQRTQARESCGSLILILPADALPTLSALVSRRLRMPENSVAAVGSYVQAHPVTCKPRSVVSFPPMGDWLLTLQPRDEPVCYPVLLRLSEEARVSVGATDGTVQLPLALRYQDAQNERQARLLAPLAPDHPGSGLHRTLTDDERQAAAISILVCMQSGFDAIAAFLESVSEQTLAVAIDAVVIIESAFAAHRPSLTKLLSRLFPERYTIIEVKGANYSAHLNLAARKAKGRYFLVADDTVLLHNSRTLEMLYLMSLESQVATASCVMLRESAWKKGTEVRFHSGGIYPSQLSFQNTPTLVFKEPYTLTAFPNATYPVSGNSFRFILVNASVWSKLDGLDSANFPNYRYDLDFCLRALKAGFIHLCTSAITASDLSDGSAEEHTDIHALNFMTHQRWQDIFSSVTVFRELD